MEQDKTMAAGVAAGAATGGATHPLVILYEVLQVGFTPDMFMAMQAIHHDHEQWFMAMESTIATSQGIEEAIRNGFRNVSVHITIPQPPAAPPSSGTSCPTPLQMTLQPFAGKTNDNVQAWLGMAEDTFTGSHVH